ncbi:hypothetical protein A3Q56_01380 [Intoshia linei]|uniref:Uncharacterized protein n=1 Tax=Intoshia linei TaxID=1819745 RepID=A0A177BB64_9BILA|nr:hypothetical protein A3Q56_01380 [Intoshia linei]
MRNPESKKKKQAFFYALLAPLAIYKVHSLIAVSIGRSYFILYILNSIILVYPIIEIIEMHENTVTTGHNIAVELTVEFVNLFYRTGMVSSLIFVPVSQIVVALFFEVIKNKDSKE